MCLKCEDLLANPRAAGLPLVNPMTQRPGIFDPHGPRICLDLDCLSLWQLDRVDGGQWHLIKTKGGLSIRRPLKRVHGRAAARKRAAG
jgi:hypothetical protein